MKDLLPPVHERRIRGIIALHIAAQLRFVRSKKQIRGRLAACRFGKAGRAHEIILPFRISKLEIEEYLFWLLMRARLEKRKRLQACVARINNEIKFLEYAVLHEIAHLKNGWGQARDIACDLWAFGQMRIDTGRS